MKNKTIKPTRSRFNVLRQICNHIPQGEVSKIARETGVEDKSRSFSPWSHTVSLLDAQLTHCIGLNDLCDSLQLHSGALSTIRGASAPSRNGLSHANRERPAAMAERLFWRTLNHLKQQSPGFGTGKRRGPAFTPRASRAKSAPNVYAVFSPKKITCTGSRKSSGIFVCSPGKT